MIDQLRANGREYKGRIYTPMNANTRPQIYANERECLLIHKQRQGTRLEVCKNIRVHLRLFAAHPSHPFAAHSVAFIRSSAAGFNCDNGGNRIWCGFW
jgi:hypothetical protein